MAKYQVSPNLIDQLQILLRKEAGLPSFNPSDHSLYPPPSVLHDAICAVGPNAESAVRCKDCKGELLRGSESVICVYCGRNHQQCPPPQPISFQSTFGYQWFIRSLSLDGSESVEPACGEGTKSDRGRSLVKDEIRLSEFLDLQLKWPDELSRFCVSNEPEKKSLKLAGVDFVELLPPEGSRDLAPRSSNNQVVASGKVEVKEITTVPEQSNLSLFQDTRLGSGEEENDESSDWAAEFQSVNTDAKVDFASHSDEIHGPVEHESSANMSLSHASLTGNIELESRSPMDSKQSEGNILVEDAKQGFEPVNDASFNWFLAAGQRQKSDGGDPPHDEKIPGGDSIDEWDEFRMFTGAGNNQSKHSITQSSAGLDISDSWNDFIGSIGAEHEQLQNEVDIGDPALGGGNDVALTATGLEQQDLDVERTHNGTSNQGQSLGSWSATAEEVDDSFDMWNDFKSSAVEHGNQQVSTTTEVDGNKMSAEDSSMFHVQYDFAGLSVGNKEQEVSTSKAVGKKSSGNHDASVASWNDNSLEISGSTCVSDSNPIGNDTSSSGPWSDFSSLMVDQVNQPQSSGTKAEENQTAFEDENGFGLWNDFSSSGTLADNSDMCSNVTTSISDKLSTAKAPENLTVDEDNNPLNSWGNFEWSSSNAQQQSHAGAEPSKNNLISKDCDLFLGLHNSGKHSTGSPDNQLRSNGVTVYDGKSTSGNDDAWSDFTSSSNVQANSWLTSSANSAVGGEADKHDPFGGWNLIGASSNNQVGTDTAEAKGGLPELNLFSTDANSQGLGSSRSLHPDPFLGMFTDQNGSAQVAFSQTEEPDLARKVYGDDKAGDFDKLNRSGRDISGTLDFKSPDVETLISEMHDLSFMLESSLSIPKSGT